PHRLLPEQRLRLGLAGHGSDREPQRNRLPLISQRPVPGADPSDRRPAPTVDSAPLAGTVMNTAELLQRLHAIRDRNAWRPLHSPKNLVMAASVEMSELLEIFQWLSEPESRQLPAEVLA